jgi:hypothetical protein
VKEVKALVVSVVEETIEVYADISAGGACKLLMTCSICIYD